MARTDAVVIDETCGCGATFSIEGASGYVTVMIEAAAKWRREHRHYDPPELAPGPLARAAEGGVGSDA